ncbi:MAG: hypothetical protein N3B16_05455 [Candidatus Aminicenantes bacterium]|nr:hypothetical protein [Candidatus Aminicenantes bacterium]
MVQLKKITIIFPLLGFLGLLSFNFLLAQNTAYLNFTVRIEKRFKVIMSTNFISFVRTSTQGKPQLIPANENPVEMTIKTNLPQGAKAKAWFIAASDLIDYSTGYTIKIETISWEAKGNGFFSGHLSKSSPVLLALISGAGEIKGILNFLFAEDPNFAPGTYQSQVTLLVEAL